MSRESSMNYAKHQIDTQLNEFLEKFNITSKKLSKGQRRIRKVRYFYQLNDLVKYNGKVYSVRGTQNGGKYIALNGIKKVPRVELLIPYKFSKGFIYS